LRQTQIWTLRVTLRVTRYRSRDKT
jgi:hypothetical protein